MGTWTNNGLNLAATAIQTAGANAAMTYVGISPGCGTLASGLTSGTPYSSISLNAGIPANVTTGQQITITDGTNTDTATVAAPGATLGATSIPLSGYTAAFTFAANLTAVAPTPQVTDSALYGESARAAVSGASAGASAGESLVSGYFDGSQPTAIYALVGYFGGASATSTTGTGTLMGADVVFWNHVANSDTFMYQSDNTI